MEKAERRRKNAKTEGTSPMSGHVPTQRDIYCVAVNTRKFSNDQAGAASVFPV